MIVTSKTLSATSAPSAKSISSQLTLRGTRDGDLAATLLSHNPSSSNTTLTTSHPSGTKPERTPLFTWAQLQTIISSGNLQLLSRHPQDLREYFAWMDSVKLSYGSVTNFLLCERFTASKLLEKAKASSCCTSKSASDCTKEGKDRCFRSYFKQGVDCQILVNDWPYSVPEGVVHHVVWSYLPILHRDLVSKPNDSDVESIAWNVVAKRGLCGTISPDTGLKIPSLQDHISHLSDLKLSLTGKDQHLQNKVEETLREACQELVRFIRDHWDMERCEAAFFANPPSLQSVPSLAHFHVLIKHI
ncbi:uncharacterized protein UTRI_01899 [Ustilago trichophora]|uniref:Uncharacterized protein n=1 Tax=Ustilago trichophora TaxID=86804 RepID=A0A5C3E135_9BASI|nr:uncharacterized protein UTRI_01899 [Ustilago trichophora]